MRFPKTRRFLSELRRRRVSHAAVGYVLAAWVLLQLGDIVVEPLGLPERTMSVLIVVLVLGFPVVLGLAWALDVTRHGIRRTPDLDEANEGPTLSSPHQAAGYVGVGAIVIAVGAGAFVLMRDGGEAATELAPDAPRVLAILPFDNRSPDPENEFFADGVTDDILTRLGRVGGLSVISRTTSMAYKGTTLRMAEIASEIGAGFLLEGSVQRIDDEVRITARLVDGRSDEQVWADVYDRSLDDLFAIQSEIARAIVDALEVELSSGVATRIEERPTADLVAYDLFLLGRESLHRYDREGTERAMEFFDRALERDPDFALARAWHARAAITYFVNHGMGIEWADSAHTLARRALDDRPGLAEAHEAMGGVMAFTGRYMEAVTRLERAIELNPSNWRATSNLGVVYSHLGRWDEAIRLTLRTLELEGLPPASPTQLNLAWYALWLGLTEQAEAVIERSLLLRPDDPYTINVAAWIDMLRGHRSAALDATGRLSERADAVPIAGLYAANLLVFGGEIERAAEVAAIAYADSPTAIFDWFSLGVLHGYALDRTGRTVEARTVLAEAERHALDRIDAGDERRTHRYALAAIHALRGDADAAFRRLDEAIEAGWNMASITRADPLLEQLRDDPRFEAALARMDRAIAPMRARVEQEAW